jgi:glycine C-acetyltransferase
MDKHFLNGLKNKIELLKAEGLYKTERVIESAQGTSITVQHNGRVINFCANNYLGLANNEEVKNAASKSIEEWGFGLSSVRFICGTQRIHLELEKRVSSFIGMEDAILYCAAFDANGGVFEPLFDEHSAIISDELNHASIIDGVRLCKAKRFRYKHSDMKDLERCLEEASDSLSKIIVTDGVFSMDGDIAKLDQICQLADKHQSLVMVDDSHATGYIGPGGKVPLNCLGLQTM